MPSPVKKGDETSLPPKHSTVLLMLTIADTTWRLFIPLVGSTILGLWVDKQIGTKPWLMIAAMLVGAMIALLLVRNQIKKVKQL